MSAPKSMRFDSERHRRLNFLQIGQNLQGEVIDIPMNRFSSLVQRAYHWACIRHAYRVHRLSPRLFPKENFRRIAAIHLEGLRNAKAS